MWTRLSSDPLPTSDRPWCFELQRAGGANPSCPCPHLSAVLVKERRCSTTKSFGQDQEEEGGREDWGGGEETKVDLQRVFFLLMCPKPGEEQKQRAGSVAE